MNSSYFRSFLQPCSLQFAMGALLVVVVGRKVVGVGHVTQDAEHLLLQQGKVVFWIGLRSLIMANISIKYILEVAKECHSWFLMEGIQFVSS